MAPSESFTRRLGVVAAAASAAGSAAVVIGISSATAAPETDSYGYVNSTARCNPPNVTVAFGNTASSRIAICKTPAGQFEYRGVRVRDGAKLIAPASQADSGAFVAEDDETTYTVTSSSLVVSSGEEVIRRDSMINFQQPGTTGSSREKSTSTTSVTTTVPTTTVPTTVPQQSESPQTPQEPLPPPLPAEEGGS